MDVGAPKLPDVDSKEINTEAWMIWEMIRNTAGYKHGRERKRNGQPGREWTGSVNELVNRIWPALTDRYLVERKEAERIKMALNRYMRDSGNLVCLRNGGTTSTSVWWVAEHWSVLDVRNVKLPDEPDLGATEFQDSTPSVPEVNASDVLDVPVPDPTPAIPTGFMEPAVTPVEDETPVDQEPDEEDDGNEVDGKLQLPCRFSEVVHDAKCSQPPMTNHQGRAAHERSHGFRVNQDGTVTLFDPRKYGRKVTIGEVKRLLVDVIKGDTSELGLTVGDILELALKGDPTITRATVKDGITKLTATPYSGYRLTREVAYVEGTRSAHTKRYRLERVTPTPKEVATTAAAPSTLVSQVFEMKTEQAASAAPSDATLTAEQHAANLRALLADLGNNTLRQQELEALQRRVDVLSAENAELRKLEVKLAEVTKERDELRAKFDAFSAAMKLFN
jgi:hypothetical protein